jgi:hypothetical protein
MTTVWGLGVRLLSGRPINFSGLVVVRGKARFGVPSQTPASAYLRWRRPAKPDRAWTLFVEREHGGVGREIKPIAFPNSGSPSI